MYRWGLELITPDIAKKYLCKNCANRPIKDKHIAFLARQMADGQFTFNGESIKFDKSGNLLDGQHRLNAVIKSGKTIQFLVIKDLDQSVMPTIDTGRKSRDAGDVLGILGERNAKNIAAALNFVIRIEKGYSLNYNAVSTQDIIDSLQRHPGIRNSIQWSRSKIVCKLLRPSLATGFHYIFSLINKELADRFFETLETGETTNGIRDAAIVIRETLFYRKIEKNRNTVLARDYEPAILIKAWNAYINGVVPLRIQYDAHREKSFPIIDDKIKVEL